MRKKKREFRGFQVNPIKIEGHWADTFYYKNEQFRDLTVDCHLGSLVLTKEDILDLLEQREMEKSKRGLVLTAPRKSTEWRNVQEKLPKRDGVVLVYCPSQKPKTGLTALAWYNPESRGDEGNGWSGLPGVWISAITHWQPIPLPPMDICDLIMEIVREL